MTTPRNNIAHLSILGHAFSMPLGREYSSTATADINIWGSGAVGSRVGPVTIYGCGAELTTAGVTVSSDPDASLSNDVTPQIGIIMRTDPSGRNPNNPRLTKGATTSILQIGVFPEARAGASFDYGDALRPSGAVTGDTGTEVGKWVLLGPVSLTWGTSVANLNAVGARITQVTDFIDANINREKIYGWNYGVRALALSASSAVDDRFSIMLF